MTTESHFRNFEGATLEGARTKANAVIADLSDAERATLTEKVFEPGPPKTVRGLGKTPDEAKIAAIAHLAQLVQVVDTKILTEFETKLIEFEAHGYEQAKVIAAQFVPEGYNKGTVEIIKNSKPGFLGFSREPGKYTIACERPAEVEVRYIEPFRIECRWSTAKVDPADDVIRSVVENAIASVFGVASTTSTSGESPGGKGGQPQRLGDLPGIRRVVDGVVCIECPKCYTDFNRKLVLQEIKKQSPFVFLSTNWTTGFVCQVCRANITISNSADD